jgi:hypothetical protein
MAVNVNNFVHSLALQLASATSLAYATAPRAIWRHRAIEDQAADPYSVLRVYGGSPLMWHPLPRLSLQVWTLGTSDDAALAQAQRLAEAFTDTDSLPRHGWVFAGQSTAGSTDGTWRIVSCDILQRPGLVGRDDRGRAEVVFNVDLGFLKAS